MSAPDPASTGPSPLSPLVRRLPLLTAAAVAFALVATAWSAYENDWTTDEPIHLEWSQRMLDEGVTERASELHFNSKTPVSALNVLARRLARRILSVNDARMSRFAARVPGLFWLALVLAATFLLAHRCGGPVAAHLATLAVAVDPNLIANSSIATVDAAYAAATLLTVLAAVGFAHRPSLAWGAGLGLALGLAFSVKFTAFLLIPGVLLLPLAAEGGVSRLWKDRRVVLTGVAMAVVVATGVVCAAYLFTHIGTPIGTVAWRSQAFRRLADAVPTLSFPLPLDFLTGLDICLNAERTKPFNVVILGQMHRSGVFYYFALVWLLKTPLLLLLGLMQGFARVLQDGTLRSNPALRYVALHFALGLAYFSFVFRMQIGYRFVLMCVPLAAVVAATGLAGLVRHRLFSPFLTAALLTAVAENALYLGNSLAFTNAAVWPKREVFRLLADSNVDYGQNREKMRAWFRGQRTPTRHLDPVHILPGENILAFNLACGTTDFSRHAWLREHLRPKGHFRHTYLFFEVSPDQFEEFLAGARRFGPTSNASDLCPATPPEAAADLVSGSSLTRDSLRGRVQLLCLRASAPADLALRNQEGEVVWGRADSPRSEWDRLRDGREAWYRLDPGTHAFVLAEASGFRGEWLVRGGSVSLAEREMRMNKRRRLRPLPEDE